MSTAKQIGKISDYICALRSIASQTECVSFEPGHMLRCRSGL